MITQKIAEMLVEETSKILNLNINIMDKQGIIIASGDSARVNMVHKGALEAISSEKTLKITTKSATGLQGTMPGVNLPINFQGDIVGVIGITGDPKEIANRGDLVKMMAELLINQSYLVTQLEWKQRTKEMVIEELLKRDPIIHEVHRWLGLLDIQLEGPYIVSLIEIDNRDHPNLTIIKQIENIFKERSVLVGFIHMNTLLIILNDFSIEEAMKKLTQATIGLHRLHLKTRLAYSSQVHHLEHIAQSYHECKLALKVTDPSVEVVAYSDVETKVLLQHVDRQIAENFSARVLIDIVEKQFETLQAYFDCDLNINRAAKKLFIHRNTMIYRLNKIKTDSGYDPQNFHDATTLQLAIWLAKVPT